MLLAVADRFDGASQQVAAAQQASLRSAEAVSGAVSMNGLSIHRSPPHGHVATPTPASWVSFPAALQGTSEGCATSGTCAGERSASSRGCHRNGHSSSAIGGKASQSNGRAAACAAFAAWPPPHWLHSSRWTDRPQAQLKAAQELNQKQSYSSSTSTSTISSGSSTSCDAAEGRQGSGGGSRVAQEKGEGSALGLSTDSREPWPPTWAGLESLPGYKQVGA